MKIKIKTTEQIAKSFNPDFDNKEKWVAVEDIKELINNEFVDLLNDLRAIGMMGKLEPNKTLNRIIKCRNNIVCDFSNKIQEGENEK